MELKVYQRMTDTIPFSHLLRVFFTYYVQAFLLPTGPLAGAVYVSPVEVVIKVIPTRQLSMQLSTASPLPQRQIIREMVFPKSGPSKTQGTTTCICRRCSWFPNGYDGCDLAAQWLGVPAAALP